jgi:hypothetical protein
MTIQEITPYANTVTRTNQRTILNLKNGSKIVGHFLDNNFKNPTDPNTWNFVIYPPTELNKASLIDGDYIQSIEIVDLW